MLASLSIKQKLILIMLIPLMVVVLLSAKLALNAYNNTKSLEKIEKIVILSTKIGALVHETQKERGMTAGFLGSKGSKFKDKLPLQRDNASAKKSDLLEYLSDFDANEYNEEFKNALTLGLNQLDNIDNIRSQVSSQSINAGAAIGYYTKMNGLFLNVIGASIQLSSSAELSQKLGAYTNFLLSKERAGIERAVGANTFARDNFGKGMRVKFNNLVAKQDAYADSFLKVASKPAREFYNETVSGSSVDEVNKMRDVLLSSGKNSKFGIEAQYWFTTITQKINLLKKVEDYLANELKNATSLEKESTFEETMIFGILSLLGIIMTLVLARTIAFTILIDVRNVKTGLEEFFAFVNFEKDDLKLIEVHSSDELGLMMQNINKNIEKTKDNIATDKELIKDTIRVANSIKNGHLDSRISLHSNNPALNELKDIINEMLDSLNVNVEKVMCVLDSYTSLNYLPKVDKEDLDGTMAKLCDDVNNLGQSITEILLENKKNGVILNQNANTLTNNLNQLSNAANVQAASLEETAASLEELTANLRANNESTIEMASYGSKVKNSVTTGQALANNTASAMDEINEQTSAISEAITVIDQIAFQTNILSLNAAVEAATAGEAGKGFAVVAQEVRNLASRSAEAAREIKDLVENAQAKTDGGKKIADDMIHGYKELNENITKTIDLIDNVTTASKEQESGIVQINDAVNNLDKLTQENAQNTASADSIAKQTGKISAIIVENANAKEFEGKDSFTFRDSTLDENFSGIEKRVIEKEIKTKRKAQHKPVVKKVLASTNNSDEWASF